VSWCGGFPYAIFYEDTDETVTVYSIFHTSRDPDKWRKRLPWSRVSRYATLGATFPNMADFGPRDTVPKRLKDRLF